MNILTNLSALVIGLATSFGIISAPTPQIIYVPQVDKSGYEAKFEDISNQLQSLKDEVESPTLGTAVPLTPALYDGYLATSISTTDTTMSVAPGTFRNGSALAGFMCFVIDVNQPTVEYVCGTASGATISGLSRGIDVLDPNTTSTALAFSHRRFASVSVADYPTIQFLVRKMNGTDSLDAPLKYSSSLATSTIASGGSNLVNVSLLNSIAISGAGAVVATETSGGYVTLASTTAQASSSVSYLGSPLVLQSQNATSTYNSATAGRKVVVTQPDGQINSGFFQTSITPIGAVIAYSSTTAPSGWLLANGASIAVSTYPALFAVIGYSYGGSGANFTLPDIKGRNILMASTTANIGQKGGESNHTQTEAELAAHTHSTIFENYSGSYTRAPGVGATTDALSGNTGSKGSSSPMNVLDPYIVLQYIIKY